MNNDNDIMKEFNDSFSDNQSTSVEPYQATQNINSYNVEVSSGINTNNQNIDIQSVTMPNFINQNPSINVVPEVSNTVNLGASLVNINSNDLQTNNYNDSQQHLYNTSNYINDSERPLQKPQKKATIKINPELKTVFLLALVLLIAMALVPVIFDLLDNLKIKLTR